MCHSPTEDVRLQHQSTQLKIFSNTVVNYFSTTYIYAFNYTGPFRAHKRTAGSLTDPSLVVDCLASQGNNQPVWITTNSLTGGKSGRVDELSQTLIYGQEILSNYVARLTFVIMNDQFTGAYTCVSEASGLFQTFYLTTGVHVYFLFPCKQF